VNTFTAPRNPVSAEARGRVRLLWASLEADAARMEAAINRVPQKTRNPTTWKGRVGTERAIQRIVAAMPVAPELRGPQMVLWRYLAPVVALPTVDDADAEPTRPGFIVKAIIAGRRMRPCRPELFGAAFTVHAVGRLLDRSAFRADPTSAMLEAHAALAAVAPMDGDKLFDLDNLEMPAADGAFLATPCRIGPEESPLAVARTWVSTGQTHPQQDRHLAAWTEFLADPVAA
jgi:hypothetical protein